MSNEIARIYVELDMLLDTRLATLEKFSVETAEKALFDDYHNRQSDDFDGLPMAQFQALYKQRDVETLKLAKMTNCTAMVANLMNQLRVQSMTRPFYKDCKLVVNFYPYQLAPEEMDAIQQMVQFRIKDVAEVQMVNIPPAQLTPEYCKMYYGMLIMYNAEEWINLHMKKLEKTKMTDIMLLTPAMYHVKKPSEEELKQIVNEAMHPLQAFELMMSFFVELKLIDVEKACIVSPQHKTSDESQKETSEAEVPVGTRETMTMNVTDLDDPSRTMEEVTIEKQADGWKHVSTKAI